MFWKRKPQPPQEPQRLTADEYRSLLLQALSAEDPAVVLADRAEDPLFGEWLAGLLRERSRYEPWAQGLIRLGALGCGRLGQVAAVVGRELAQGEQPPVVEVVTPSMPGSTDGITPPVDQTGVADVATELPLTGEDAQGLLQGAQQQLQFGLHQAALASFERVLRLDGNSVAAWEGKGAALKQLKRFEEANQAVETALQLKMSSLTHGHHLGSAPVDQQFDLAQTDAEVWFNQGNNRFMAGAFAGAIASYDKALQSKPDLHEAWYNRGVALVNLGQFEIAIVSFDTALQIKPDFLLAWYNYGVVLEKLGQFEDAIASYDKALQIKSDLHEAWQGRGAALGKLGQFEDAIASYDKALQIKPDKHEVWNNRGMALGNLGQHEEAITSYDEALQIKPDDYEVWLNRGIAFGKLGQFSDEISSFDKALLIKADLYEALFNRGLAFENLGQFEHAIVSFKQAVRINPDFHEAWCHQGTVLVRLGQFDDAVTSWNEALRIKPDDHKTWCNRGSALANLDQHKNAITSFDKAVSINPNDDRTWYCRGLALADLDKLEAAIASYDKALQIRLTYHEAWGNRGLALYGLRRFEEAIASYAQALIIKPDKHEVWNNRGIALAALDQFENAIASYDQTLRIKPDDHKAWHNRSIAVAQSSGYDSSATSIRRFELIFAAYRSSLTTTFGNSTDILNNFQHQPISTALQNTLLIQIAHAATLPESLKVRDWEGCLASYHAGLTHCPPTTHPLGHSYLQTRLGNAYCKRARLEANPRPLWHQAILAYDIALQVLTDDPTEYLEALQNLIRPLLALGEVDRARDLRIQAVARFNDLINTAPTSAQKRRLETQFSRLAHIQIDSLIADHEIPLALETADRTKNRTLTWILDQWQAQVHSPTYADVQRHLLTNPHTAALYWHLSDDALTTFLLLPDRSEPIVLDRDYTALRQQHHRFTDWLKQWDTDYSDYRSKKRDPADRQQHPWRTHLASRLEALKEILQIAAISPHLTDIHHLILLPHRDLHRLPLHGLFLDADGDRDRFTFSYLPSLQLGITLQTATQNPAPVPAPLLSIADPDRDDTDPLRFARLESALLQTLCDPHTAIAPAAATLEVVTAALKTHSGPVHFTGHGDYNSRQPEASALALTGSDLLTAQTLAALPLDRLTLVSLSACETALSGNQTLDTEYVGLTSALLKAGVAHVISTLWTVEEVSNAYLMIRFYQAYLAGTPPAIALQIAQTWLRSLTLPALADWLQALPRPLDNNDINEQLESLIRRTQSALTMETPQVTREVYPYADPYYWAAFTFTGTFTDSHG